MQKIRHKHTLARNHFSKMSTMGNYFKGGQGHRKKAQSDLEDLEEESEVYSDEDDQHSFKSVSVDT